MSLELQTRIVTTRDDWSLARFELLASISREKNDDFESRLFAVTTCGREPLEAANPVLSILYRGDFEEVWLSTVDTGAAFRQREYVGSPGQFRSTGPTVIPAPTMSCGSSRLRQISVSYALTSGRPPTLLCSCRVALARGAAHGQEDRDALVIRNGFNLAVAFECSRGRGRFIAECRLHRFAEDNFDLQWAHPSFVNEPAGVPMLRDPAAVASVRVYVRNVATWLALLESDEWESLVWNRSLESFSHA
jgi:hypothetical protein